MDFNIDSCLRFREAGKARLSALLGQRRVIDRIHPTDGSTNGHRVEVVMEDEPRLERPAQISGELQLSPGCLRQVDRTENGSNRNHGPPTIHG